MKLEILKGATDVTIYLFLQDSSSTTGAGKTGLAFNTASLVCYYVRPLGSATALTLATQTVTGAHSDGGFVEVDATNMPGLYRLDLSDAIIASGVNSVALLLKGAANLAPLPIELQLVSYNPNDAVRLGLTALPNAAAEAAGGLYTRGTGAGQINQNANGQVDTRWVAGNVTVGTNNDKTGYAIGTGGIAAAAFAANAIDAAALAADAVTEIQSGLATSTTQTTILNRLGAWTGSARNTVLGALQALFRKDADATVPSDINADLGGGAGSADNTTDSTEALRDNMGTPQTGDSFARLGAPAGANVSADVAAVKSQTAAIEVDTQDLQGRLPAALTGAGHLKADALAISGDATAADNLEAAADGTGFNLGAGAIVAASVTGAVGSIGAGGVAAASLAVGAKDAIADAVLDEVVEGAVTLRQSTRLANAANGGKLSGAATTSVAIRDLADSKDRIDATVTSEGNRTAITLDLT